MKKIFLTLISLLISAVLVYYLLKIFNWDSLKYIFLKIGLINILICVILYISTFILRGYRWGLLLISRNVTGMDLFYLSKVTLIGYAANNLLPFRLGEVVRSLILYDKFKVSRSFSIGTVFIERFFDLFSIILLLLIASYLNFNNFLLFSNIFIYFSIVLFLVCIIFIANKVSNNIIFSKIFFMLRIIINHPIFFEFVNSFKQNKDLKILLKISLISVSIWILEVLVLTYILFNLGFESYFQASLLTIPILNLGTIIPSAPGYIGIFQGGFVLAFAMLGLDKVEALSISIFLHFIQFFSVNIIGIYFIYQLDLFSKIINKIFDYAKRD